MQDEVLNREGGRDRHVDEGNSVFIVDVGILGLGVGVLVYELGDPEVSEIGGFGLVIRAEESSAYHLNLSFNLCILLSLFPKSKRAIFYKASRTKQTAKISLNSSEYSCEHPNEHSQKIRHESTTPRAEQGPRPGNCFEQ